MAVIPKWMQFFCQTTWFKSESLRFNHMLIVWFKHNVVVCRGKITKEKCHCLITYATKCKCIVEDKNHTQIFA